MKSRIKNAARGLLRPIGAALARAGVAPDAVTLTGFGASALAAWGFLRADGRLAFAGILASGLLDMLDGAVARARGGPANPFGAALDSTADRYGEGLIFAAILVRLAQAGGAWWLLLLAVTAGIGSYLVSYVRARSEGLGIPCEGGVLERPERVGLLLVLAAWGPRGMPWILGALALLSHVTFIQRLARVRGRKARGASEPAAEGDKPVRRPVQKARP